MNEIERIRRYIDKVKIPNTIANRYGMPFSEVRALRDKMESDCLSAICFAFTYGRAKGYRAAKAEDKV